MSTIIPQAKWLDIKDAPKDGTIVLLLVRFTENSTEDEQQAVTIGANTADHTGETHWEFAGWSWSYDVFTKGEGEVVGWWPVSHPEIPE